jgi:hypothetical protein
MTQDGDLAEGTRKAIKLGICALLVEQVLVNAYLVYLQKRAFPVPTDPRVLKPFT